MPAPLLAQVRVEPIHPRLPCPVARLDPLDRVVERIDLEPARPPMRLEAARNQPINEIINTIRRENEWRYVRRSASAWIASSECSTACSHADATRSVHHEPSFHRSLPISPV
jgi:hypothetical protein